MENYRQQAARTWARFVVSVFFEYQAHGLISWPHFADYLSATQRQNLQEREAELRQLLDQKPLPTTLGVQPHNDT